MLFSLCSALYALFNGHRINAALLELEWAHNFWDRVEIVLWASGSGRVRALQNLALILSCFDKFGCEPVGLLKLGLVLWLRFSSIFVIKPTKGFP